MESELLSCPICYEGFGTSTRIPRVLPLCGHTICSNCLKSLLNGLTVAKCPLDKTKFAEQKNIEAFPVNIVVSQMLDEKLNREICEEHQEQITFLCLTDKCKICDTCVWQSKHAGHKIKPITLIKSEANKAKKGITEILGNFDTANTELEQILEEKRLSVLKIIKERFKEMQTTLYFQELELSFLTNRFFSIEKDKINGAIGDHSNLQHSLKAYLSGLKNVLKNENFLTDDNFFSKIEEYIEECTFKLNSPIMTNQIPEVKEKLESVCKSLDASLGIYTSFWPEIDLPSIDLSEKFVGAFSGEHVKGGLSLQEIRMTPFRIKTQFSFFCNGNYLKIAYQNAESKDVEINMTKWQETKEVTIELKQDVSQEHELQLFAFIWRNLKKASSLTLKLSEGMLSNGIFKCIGHIPRSFTKIKLDLTDCNLDNHTKVLSLIERIFSWATSLNQFSLKLDRSKNSRAVIDTLFRKGALHVEHIEDFDISLSNTGVTDNDISCIFIPMPSLKKYALWVDDTKVTDASIEAFIANTLPHIKDFDHFDMCLHSAKVTDSSMSHLFENLRVKKLTLDLGQTKITDKTIEALVDKMGESLASLEEFSLSLAATKVSDQGLFRMFKDINLSSVKNFLLGLYKTKVTDDTIEIFSQKVLPSMKELETFEVWLHNTEISDSGVEQIFLNLKNVENIKKFLVDISSTSVTDRGLEYLVKEVLPHMKGLTQLDLNVNKTSLSKEMHAKVQEFMDNLKN